MQLAHPPYEHLPARCVGHRLGTLSFRTGDSSFVYMMHEGAWQGSIVFTGYAVSRSNPGPLTLSSFTTTGPGFISQGRLRPVILPVKTDWQLDFPDLDNPGGPPVQAEVISLSTVSPYLSEDGASPDAVAFVMKLADGTLIAEGEITGYARALAASTAFAIAFGVTAAIGAIAYFATAEDNRHEEEMRRMELIEKALDKGYKVEYKSNVEHSASGGGGDGGQGGGSMSASGTLTLTPPSAPQPPSGN